mmetsp:Transcript_6772/g.13248  ORF Transcript_6772/g.13248 Transcript_6772/m.13248 type:complete len:200 (-) Transcript_6772:101-700(-)
MTPMLNPPCPSPAGPEPRTLSGRHSSKQLCTQNGVTASISGSTPPISALSAAIRSESSDSSASTVAAGPVAPHFALVLRLACSLRACSHGSVSGGTCDSSSGTLPGHRCACSKSISAMRSSMRQAGEPRDGKQSRTVEKSGIRTKSMNDSCALHCPRGVWRSFMNAESGTRFSCSRRNCWWNSVSTLPPNLYATGGDMP